MRTSLAAQEQAYSIKAELDSVEKGHVATGVVSDIDHPGRYSMQPFLPIFFTVFGRCEEGNVHPLGLVGCWG